MMIENLENVKVILAQAVPVRKDSDSN